MSRRSRRRWYTPLVTIIAALLLSIVPLPAAIAPFRPDWVALALLYWCLVEPERYSLFSAFFIGLVLDALTGSLLGQHSLALIVIVFLWQRLYLQIRTFPASQLAIVVIILLAIYEFILLWIDGLAQLQQPFVERWGPVLTGGILWLLVMSGVERGRRSAESRM
jgi:rod shape-determining protein MreD